MAGKTCDLVVDMDATSPLRQVSDIVDLVQMLETSGVGNVFSVTPARRSPYFNMVEIDADGAPYLSKSIQGEQVVRRQDAPACYDINGSIYGWTRECLMTNDRLFLATTRAFLMPEERSHDIDSPVDWRIVEMLMPPETGG